MPSSTLTRLGSKLRAVNRIRFDGARLALWASVLGALSATLTTVLPSQAGTLAWLVDLAAHWQWLYVFVGAASGAVLMFRGSRLPVILAAVLIGAGWLTASESAPAATSASNPLFTVASANLKLGQADLEALHQWVGGRGADVLVLQEVTHASARVISNWKDFPYQLVAPEEGPFGLAVLSRYPIADSEALESNEQPLRYRTFVLWQGQRVGISAIHPMPPIDPRHHKRRGDLLHEEALWARTVASPGIVAGDLNATPWSSAMRAVVPAGLRRATGLQPTWPGILPVIPIDHILTTEEWRIVDSGVGPEIGSDHRPVIAVLSLGAPNVGGDGPTYDKLYADHEAMQNYEIATLASTSGLLSAYRYATDRCRGGASVFSNCPVGVSTSSVESS